MVGEAFHFGFHGRLSFGPDINGARRVFTDEDGGQPRRTSSLRAKLGGCCRCRLAN
jgi:hypothetical protein